jgi:hypothetical protein
VGPDQTLTLQAFTGFCPPCELADLTAIDEGPLTFGASARRTAEVELNVGAMTGRFRRGPVAIVPLGEAVLDLSVF